MARLAVGVSASAGPTWAGCVTVGPGDLDRAMSPLPANEGPDNATVKTFTDPRLCATIVDRLTFGGNIIETGTTS